VKARSPWSQGIHLVQVVAVILSLSQYWGIVSTAKFSMRLPNPYSFPSKTKNKKRSSGDKSKKCTPICIDPGIISIRNK